MPESTYDDRKAAIITAALQVFGAKGYERATNKEIAKEAGVTAAALYWYFPSKEDLFKAVVEGQRGKLANVAALLEMMKNLPPEDVLKRMVLGVATMFQEEENQHFARIFLGEAVRSDLVANVLEEDLVQPVVFLVRDYLAYQMEQGHLRQTDAGLAAQLFMGSMMAAFVMRNVLRHKRLQHVTNEQIAEEAVAVFLSGLQNRSRKQA